MIYIGSMCWRTRVGCDQGVGALVPGQRIQGVDAQQGVAVEQSCAQISHYVGYALNQRTKKT